jgi:hypothetical protein
MMSATLTPSPASFFATKPLVNPMSRPVTAAGTSDSSRRLQGARMPGASDAGGIQGGSRVTRPATIGRVTGSSVSARAYCVGRVIEVVAAEGCQAGSGRLCIAIRPSRH